MNWHKLKWIFFVRPNLTIVHWIRLSLLCRCKWTRKSDLWSGNVSEQYLLLCKNKKVYCVYTRIVSTQDSCTCTTLLCMHNTLVHALEGPGTKAGTQKKQPPRAGPAAAFCLGPGIGPWPLQCMHKSVVHAQECCACTRILWHNIPVGTSWYVFCRHNST